jgi:hypothetical protein
MQQIFRDCGSNRVLFFPLGSEIALLLIRPTVHSTINYWQHFLFFTTQNRDDPARNPRVVWFSPRVRSTVTVSIGPGFRDEGA